jgi:hypothetical protein
LEDSVALVLAGQIDEPLGDATAGGEFSDDRDGEVVAELSLEPGGEPSGVVGDDAAVRAVFEFGVRFAAVG